MINVLIKDDDFLYHYSLRLFITDIFRFEHAKAVNFLEGYESHNISRADIIVYALCKGEHLTCFPELKPARRGVIIGISTSEEPATSFLPNCLHDAFFVSRSAPLSAFRKTFRQAWNAYSMSYGSVASKLCEGCQYKKLSQRELGIMAGFYRGGPTSQIAKEMMLTPKTVYAHKYSVMHKFNLSSEHELLELLNSLLEKRCNPNFFREALEQLR